MKIAKKSDSRLVHAYTARYVYARDGGICIYCGNYANELDHVIPSLDGGMSIRSNLVCACRGCNMKKAYNPKDDSWLATAILWLGEKGEDIAWMDDFYR